MSADTRVLIIEDDENLRLVLADNLEDEGYTVATAANGAAAIDAVAAATPDVIVLDIMLPDTDGYTLCRRWRAEQLPSRILMLTARTLEDDLVTGFDAGADDYLGKPYRLRELLARVRALARRRIGAAPERFQLGPWTVDLDARRVTGAGDAEVHLTPTELDLLALLVRERGRALSRDAILDRVWGVDVVVDPRTVDNFVSSLKKKLGWEPGAGYEIATVRGVGYRMEIG